MEEIGKGVGVIFLVLCSVLVIVCAFLTIANLSMNCHCQDYGYFDAIHIHGQGWYCVGLAESKEPFIISYDLVIEND